MKKVVILLACLFGSYYGFCQDSSNNLLAVNIQLFNDDAGNTNISAHAFFSIGFELTCPPLEGYNIRQEGDTLQVDFYYYTGGAWPLVGCDRYDTIPLGRIPDDVNAINLISGTVVYQWEDSTHKDTTALFDTVAVLNPTGISTHNFNQVFWLKIAPNPVADYLHLEAKQGVVVQSLALTDIQGRVLKSYPQWKGDKIDVRNLAPGIYFLKVQATDGRMGVLKVLKL